MHGSSVGKQFGLKVSLAKVLVCVLFVNAYLVWAPSSSFGDQKIGILFSHVGQSEDYRFDWIPQFFDVLFDIFPPGLFAGGRFEGGDCYTFIHYADEAEADICKVDPGTPIDALCNTYTGDYPVHSLFDHAPLVGDGSYHHACYPLPNPFFPLAFGITTTDPNTGKLLYGPHVDDPDAAGKGIIDFYELVSFAAMQKYHRLPQMKNFHRKHALKFWYGNSIPSYYGYDNDTEELENVKDRLTALYPDSTFVFRHGWECYKQNMDPYGNYTYYPDSIETAVNELIDIEKVDSIISLRGPAAFSNSVEYGHEWYDDNGSAVSALPGKTFKECTEDANDNVGPATTRDVSDYLLQKPWPKHDLHLLPMIKKMAGEHNPAVQVVFAKPYGEYEEFGMSLLEMLKYTVAKYNIPETASLKYILVHHGYYGFYKGAQNCDCYFKTQEEAYNRAKQVIEKNFVWSGKFEVANAGAEFAERSAEGDNNVDPPSRDKPFGSVWSQGEQIDVAINGKYVDELGQLVDNGDDNFDYVIVCPYYFDTASTDTLYEKRSPLGNNIPSGQYYERDELDEDGTEYDQEDIDSEDFTVKVYDGTGWPSTPLCGLEPVYKGSTTKPTTVIVTGEILALGNGPTRKYFTDATIKAAAEAIDKLKNQQ